MSTTTDNEARKNQNRKKNMNLEPLGGTNYRRATTCYPETVAEWLRRWDNGDPVWSVEMGGIGPGHEQCIQIIAAEMMRSLVKECSNNEDLLDAGKWTAVEVSENVRKVVNKLRPSGAQYEAAKNIASVFWCKTPQVALSDEAVKDRKILVSKNFPAAC